MYSYENFTPRSRRRRRPAPAAPMWWGIHRGGRLPLRGESANFAGRMKTLPHPLFCSTLRRGFCALLLGAASLAAVAAPRPDSLDSRGYLNVRGLAGAVKDRITLSGYAQMGFDYYQRSEPRDQFKVARAIVFATARVTRDVTARVMFDFKGARMLEAWANYRVAEGLQVKVGQFKTPFSIENPISPTAAELIFPTSLATGYMVGGASALTLPGSTGRDIGLSLHGNLWRGRAEYDLALMNGSGRGQSDENAQKDFVGRVGLRPWRVLLLSASTMLGTGHVDVHPTADGRYVSDAAPIGGLKGNGNFRRQHYAVGAQLTTDPVNVRSEYMAGREGSSHSRAFYATASANRVVGNLDVVGSYDWLDAPTGLKQRYTAGLQYWFYKHCRLQVSYSRLRPHGAADENIILSQIQVAF